MISIFYQKHTMPILFKFHHNLYKKLSMQSLNNTVNVIIESQFFAYYLHKHVSYSTCPLFKLAFCIHSTKNLIYICNALLCLPSDSLRFNCTCHLLISSPVLVQKSVLLHNAILNLHLFVNQLNYIYQLTVNIFHRHKVYQSKYLCVSYT